MFDLPSALSELRDRIAMLGSYESVAEPNLESRMRGAGGVARKLSGCGVALDRFDDQPCVRERSACP